MTIVVSLSKKFMPLRPWVAVSLALNAFHAIAQIWWIGLHYRSAGMGPHPFAATIFVLVEMFMVFMVWYVALSDVKINEEKSYEASMNPDPLFHSDPDAALSEDSWKYYGGGMLATGAWLLVFFVL